MDSQSSFELLKKLFVDSLILCRFVMVFQILQTIRQRSEKNVAKYFWIVPFRLP